MGKYDFTLSTHGVRHDKLGSIVTRIWVSRNDELDQEGAVAQPVDKSRSHETAYEQQDLCVKLIDSAGLTKTERLCVLKHIVCDDTLQSIGDELGCTRENVRRIVLCALDKLRAKARTLIN